MKLHDLRPNQGAKKKRKRLGRGISSGHGKTSGRGTKGQNARSGGGKGIYFEGGQLPLARRLPYKRGFTNIRKIYYCPVNLKDLADLPADTEVTPVLLAEMGLIKKASNPVVILGQGELSAPLVIQAHRFSKSAQQKIESSGGKFEILDFPS